MEMEFEGERCETTAAEGDLVKPHAKVDQNGKKPDAISKSFSEVCSKSLTGINDRIGTCQNHLQLLRNERGPEELVDVLGTLLEHCSEAAKCLNKLNNIVTKTYLTDPEVDQP